MAISKTRFAGNSFISVGLLLVPLLAECAAMVRGAVPGAGIDAFGKPLAGAACLLFLVFNLIMSRKAGENWLHGAGLGIVLSASWMLVGLLIVLQVHFWRGGSL